MPKPACRQRPRRPLPAAMAPRPVPVLLVVREGLEFISEPGGIGQCRSCLSRRREYLQCAPTRPVAVKIPALGYFASSWHPRWIKAQYFSGTASRPCLITPHLPKNRARYGPASIFLLAGWLAILSVSIFLIKWIPHATLLAAVHAYGLVSNSVWRVHPKPATKFTKIINNSHDAETLS